MLYCIGNNAFIWHTTEDVLDTVDQARHERRIAKDADLIVSCVDDVGDELWRTSIDDFIDLYDDPHRRIRNALADGPMHYEELAAKVGYRADETFGHLCLMEMHGEVVRVPGGLFATAYHEIARFVMG